MSNTTNPLANPRMTAAIAELTDLISRSYPGTTYVTEVDEDGKTVFVTATVDVDDPDEVVDLYIDRSVTLLVDEGLPLHVIAVRTPERREKLLASMGIGESLGWTPHADVG
jgi:hypothetical protein